MAADRFTWGMGDIGNDVFWLRVAKDVETLFEIIGRLEASFRPRKFTLDGHLAGSLGEVIVGFMFDLNLTRAGAKGCDAKTREGRTVEIKLSGAGHAALRDHDALPDHLIVVQLHRNPSTEGGKRIEVIFNGPIAPVWAAAIPSRRSGSRLIRRAKLVAMDALVDANDRLPLVRSAPI